MSNVLSEYIIDRRAELERLLIEEGAILFRGFRIAGPVGLKACAENFGARPFRYTGGNSPRQRVNTDVYTSTEYPASEAISLHNEMSYLPSWPRRIFFYSMVPPASGGETSLASSIAVLRTLRQDAISSFFDMKINYIRNFHPRIPLGRSWQETYGTEELDQLYETVTAQGSTYDWSSSGALRVSTVCPTIATHPETGVEVWFNQAEQWHPSALPHSLRSLFEKTLGFGQFPHDCVYADGEPIEEVVLRQIRSALCEKKHLLHWQLEDLLVLDNMLVMHGREPFQGERKILTYLSAT